MSTTTTTKITPDPCRMQDCERIATTVGLCNAHYMAMYRKTQEMLEGEKSNLLNVHGDVTAWQCDGGKTCDRAPVMYYAEDGEDLDNALALCETHRQVEIDRLRINLRRLEAKT
jgi:hypothetical protein